MDGSQYNAGKCGTITFPILRYFQGVTRRDTMSFRRESNLFVRSEDKTLQNKTSLQNIFNA